MTALKKSLLVILSLIAALCAGIAVLSACADNDDLKVTFLVQDDATGAWQTYAEEDVVDGSVTLPSAPDKDYYTFRNWYYSSDGTGEVFTGSDITESVSVYAIYVADQATVYIDGQSLGTQNIIDAVNGTIVPENDNLVFDGWYTDANYTVSYTAGTETENLYGRFLAEITFDNGHEVVYTARVTPGEDMDEPSSSDIVKWYMDPNNIYYQDEDGYDLDFADGVSFDKNTTVTVLWCTPVKYIVYNDSYDSYVVSMVDLDSSMMRSIPAFSFLSSMRADIDDDGDLETITVTAISNSYSLTEYSGVETIIVGEGIESIYNCFNGSANVSKIVLPSTLNIIGHSFNGEMKLEEDLVLPEGLEVIIDSFHGTDELTPGGYSIIVPSTVKNLCAVPSNMVFTNNSNFVNEDGVIYQVNDSRGKILISAYSLVENGVLYVPEDAVGIQVGAFSGLELDGLFIYGSWEFINYNEPQTSYPEYWTSRTSGAVSYAPTANALYSEATMYAAYGSAICNDAVTVVIYQQQLPADVAENVLEGCGTVLYIGTIEDGEIATVEVTIVNWTTGVTSDPVTFDWTAGEALSIEDIIANVDELNYIGEYLVVSSVQQFGIEYNFSAKVNSNLYLTVYYGYEALGFTYEVNADGTATVTGFDEDTAYSLGNADFLVYIPETITVDGVTYTITAIADDAFNTDYATTNGNYDNVTHIVIPATVTTIGARAFYKCYNLVYVYIIPGGLEVIGESAFEGAGITSIALPVANLKEIGPYAFKTPSLVTFESAEGEENRELYTRNADLTSTLYEGIEEGMFFIFHNMIVQYTGTEVVQQPTSTVDDTLVDVKVYDVRVYATAGAGDNVNDGTSNTYKPIVYLGSSTRRSASGLQDAVVRYEVMEGSFYYRESANTLLFAIVSKIHTNAFTDMVISSPSTVWCYQGSSTTVYDIWLTLDQVSAIAYADYDFDAEDAIFEDGWWEGITVDDPDYETKMAFMANPVNYNTIIR